MILEPLFVMMCQGIGSETPGHAQASCQSILNASSDQSKATETMNELQSYSEHFVYKNINGELIKTVIALGFIENSIQQQKVIAQIPLQPFEFDVNLSKDSKQIGGKFKYEF